MAWTAPMTAVANTAFTAAQFNLHVRDNLLETAPAKATQSGGYFVTAGANAIVQKFPESSYVAAFQTTTSSSYTDLGTVGPQVTLDCESGALVFWTMQAEQAGAASGSVRSSIEITGETTVIPHDERCLIVRGTTTSFSRMSVHHHFTGLNPGSHTFTMKYLANSGTGNFGRRHMTVVPF